jgi:hypothetical protein
MAVAGIDMKITPVIIGVISVAVLLAFLLFIGYGMTPPDAHDVRLKYEDSLVSLDGVTGVCTYPDTNEIGVMVENQSVADNLPPKIGGCPIRVTVTGKLTTYSASAAPITAGVYAGPGSQPASRAAESSLVIPDPNTNSRDVKAYAASTTPTGTDRPVVGGISVGSAAFPRAAGTLGLVVKNATGNNLYVLSCAHVLAFNSAGDFTSIGTPVWQPGGYNAGSPVDQIATLARYVPITFFRSGTNYADAAIARLEVSGLPYQVLDPTNGTFYTLNGTATVAVGDTVRKSGITTGVTTNLVLSTDAVVRVFVTENKWAIFRDQIITGAIGEPGDSGAAVDKDGRFVGLYFAGSDNIGIICKAQYILEPLNVTI